MSHYEELYMAVHGLVNHYNRTYWDKRVRPLLENLKDKIDAPEPPPDVKPEQNKKKGK